MAAKSSMKCSEGEGKDKAKWDDNKTEIFLKLFVEEINTRNKPGTHSRREEWKNLQQKFHEKIGFAYDKTKLKNRWDSLKREFTSFAKLVEKETSLRWDHEKKKLYKLLKGGGLIRPRYVYVY